MTTIKNPSPTSSFLKTTFTRLSIGITLALILLIITLTVWAISGGVFPLMHSIFVQPSYERLTSQFELLGVEPTDTVFLGDSLTEYGAWEELFPNSNTRNRGIVGDTTTGVIARLDQVTAGQPAQIFLMIGTNDLFSGTSQADIIINIVYIVDAIHEASPQTEIFVQSLLPRQAIFQQDIESINAELETAIEGKATWVNLYPLFLNDAGIALEETLTNDELHLNGHGYMIWRDNINHLVKTNNDEVAHSANNQRSESQ